MWNAALRRVVRDEEEREREKRVTAQLRLKREAQLASSAAASAAASIAASIAASSASVAPGAAPEGSALSVATEREQDGSEQAKDGDAAVAVESAAALALPVVVVGTAAAQESRGEDEEEEEEEDHIQRHLLSLPKSKWSCLEDSQQAFCLSMNRQKTVFAVGEREGRISVWDNVSIRVITRELDPTLIALPEASEAADRADKQTATTSDNAANDQECEPKKIPRVAHAGAEQRRSGDVTPEEEEKADAEDDSATNDDGSVEADDDMEEEEEDEDGAEEDDEEQDEEDVVSVEEEGGANTEEDQDEEEEDEEDEVMDDEEEELENDEASSSAAQKKKRSTRQAVPTSTTSTASRTDQALESDAASVTKQHSNGLSLEDLRVVKTSLKVVMNCAWSCDTRWLFAGCEEKGNRRGRLCVWDVEAASIFATFRYLNSDIVCLSTLYVAR